MAEPTLWRRCPDCGVLYCHHSKGHPAGLVPVAAGAVLIEDADHDTLCQLIEDTLSNYFRNPAKVGEAATAVLNTVRGRYGMTRGEQP